MWNTLQWDSSLGPSTLVSRCFSFTSLLFPIATRLPGWGHKLSDHWLTYTGTIRIIAVLLPLGQEYIQQLGTKKKSTMKPLPFLHVQGRYAARHGPWEGWLCVETGCALPKASVPAEQYTHPLEPNYYKNGINIFIFGAGICEVHKLKISASPVFETAM